MFASVNLIAVLVSALLAVAVGNVWYSPIVFGNIWMRVLGKSADDVPSPSRETFRLVVLSVLVHSVFFYVLALGLVRVADFGISLREMALFVSIVIGVQVLGGFLWEKRPLLLFLVVFGYVCVITCGGLAVIAYWPW